MKEHKNRRGRIATYYWNTDCGVLSFDDTFPDDMSRKGRNGSERTLFFLRKSFRDEDAVRAMRKEIRNVRKGRRKGAVRVSFDTRPGTGKDDNKPRTLVVNLALVAQ